MASAWVVSLLAGLVGAAFAATVAAQYARAHRPYQLAWAAGLAAYAGAALLEAAGVGIGWTPLLYRLYFPLAAGTVGLLGLGTVLLVLPRRVALGSTLLVLALIAIAALAPLAQPLPDALPPDVGAKAVPFPNPGRFAFLVLNVAGGLALIVGALWSWWTTRRAGVLLIGVGAMAPFLGGTLSTLSAFDLRALLQFIGIAVMFAGYLQGRESRPSEPARDAAEA